MPPIGLIAIAGPSEPEPQKWYQGTRWVGIWCAVGFVGLIWYLGGEGERQRRWAREDKR
jgi:hypothetical protein